MLSAETIADLKARVLHAIDRERIDFTIDTMTLLHLIAMVERTEGLRASLVEIKGFLAAGYKPDNVFVQAAMARADQRG